MYAIEYTDMAKHARRVVQANGVDHIVTVIQGAVEEVVLPEEDWDGVGLALEEGGDVLMEPRTNVWWISSCQNGWATSSYVNPCSIP